MAVSKARYMHRLLRSWRRIGTAAPIRCNAGTASATAWLYEGYARCPADLVELMRKIVSLGSRGRKQDIVPKEVRVHGCMRGLILQAKRNFQLYSST